MEGAFGAAELEEDAPAVYFGVAADLGAGMDGLHRLPTASVEGRGPILFRDADDAAFSGSGAGMSKSSTMTGVDRSTIQRSSGCPSGLRMFRTP